MLDALSKYHNEWLKIAFSFTNNKEDAEDVVQDMYVKLYKKKPKNNNYPDGVNKYFVYITLKNLSLDYLKKRVNHSELHENIIDNDEEKDVCLLDVIDQEMKNWSNYEKNLFEIYMYSGLSLRDICNGTDKKPKKISNISELSEIAVKSGTGISLSSTFLTIKNCKDKINERLQQIRQEN